MASLSDQDKQKCLYHLGYLGTSLGATIALGIPAAIPTMFIAAFSLALLQDDNWFSDFHRILSILDGIETKMVQAQDRLAARVAGSVTMNPTEIDDLENEYRRWGYRLADILGTPVNPYSPRYSSGGICVARA